MKHRLIFLFLVVVGLSQLIGDILQLPSLKTIGAVTGASPAPKVFTAHKGFETYSSRFFIEWKDKAQHAHSLQLTPATYRNIKGPYNRRNAYGATFSYAPVFVSNPVTKPMFESAAHYALCGKAPILNALNINPDNIAGALHIRLQPRQKLPNNHPWKLNFEVTCNE